MQAIILPAIPSPLCLVKAVHEFLSVRGSRPGQFFVGHDFSPLSSYKVRKVIQKLAVLLGLRETSLSPHVFRVGAATTAASLGIADDIITRMGRWSSDAYKKYIRCHANWT